jgi:hypothetical protein
MGRSGRERKGSEGVDVFVVVVDIRYQKETGNHPWYGQLGAEQAQSARFSDQPRV